MYLNSWLNFFGLWLILSVCKGNLWRYGKSKDEPLSFWKPDPQYNDARKSNDKSSKTNLTHNIINDPKDTKRATDKVSRKISNEKIKVEPLNASKKGQVRRSTTTKALNSKANFRAKQNTKDQKNKRTKPHGAALRSTRMTPMTDDAAPVEQKTSTTDRYSKYLNETKAAVPLNPYAIIPQFRQIFSKFPEAKVTHEIVGRTASFIDIVMFKISQIKSDYNEPAVTPGDSKYSDEVPEKKVVFIVHALSSMGIFNLCTLTREKYIETLISYYLKHLDKFDIFLIPMANPDGFIKHKSLAHSGQAIHLWSRNMSPQSGCPGVDLDRNFDVWWTDSQAPACSPHYAGPAPFSEPESRAVRDVLHRHTQNIVAYLHVHAGTYSAATFKGDAVLYPPGYTFAADDDKYLDIKMDIDEAMRNASFRALSVTVDSLHSWYGKVTGTSVDYASTIYGIPYAMELVMQVYMNVGDALLKSMLFGNPDADLQYYALTEIWGRVLDVVFTHIAGRYDATDSDM